MKLPSLFARLPRITFEKKDANDHIKSPVITYYLIIFSAIFLGVIGLYMGFSASAVENISHNGSPYHTFFRSVAIAIFALICAAWALRVSESQWWKASPYIFCIALFLQFLVLSPLGTEVGGNRNWLSIPGLGMTFQPSEFLKFGLILLLARAIARPGARINDWRQMLATVGFPIFIAVCAVIAGRDLGTCLIMMGCAVGVLWVGGLPKKWFLAPIPVIAPLVALLVASNPTRMKRITDVLPWNDYKRNLLKPEQIDHAYWAFGGGGLTGLGPGASREKWNHLRAASTDFVLAIFGEEFGFIGILVLFTCLVVLVWGILRICFAHSSYYAQILAGGVAAWISIQAITNIMSVTRMGPVIGVPFPLVSYGGSSLLFTAVAIAAVASLARKQAGMRMHGESRVDETRRDPRQRSRRHPLRVWRASHHQKFRGSKPRGKVSQ